MWFPFFFFPFLLLAQVAQLAQAKDTTSYRYSWSDLNSLAQSQNHREFLQHAHDIPPGQRDQAWKDMVGQMAMDYLKKIEQQQRESAQGLGPMAVDWSSLNLIQKISSWPLLDKNAYFASKRDDLLLNFLNQCLTSSEQQSCFPLLRSFWPKALQRDYLAAKLLELIQSHSEKLPSTLDLWPLLKTLTTSDKGDQWCGREFIQGRLLQKMSQQVLAVAEISQWPKVLQTTFSSACFQQLKKTLRQAIISPDSTRIVRKLSYVLLQMNHQLSPLGRHFYHVLYFLQGPTVGELFNQSWSTIEKLARNYRQRKQVLKLLMAMDPLPGEIFHLADKSKQKVLLNHLHKHFPEYMDQYARTCLAYYSNSQVFARGNPTVHCPWLFLRSANRPWVDPDLKRKYKQLGVAHLRKP